MQQSNHDETHEAGHHQHLHVTPFWPMLVVFIVLLGFTALTVYTAGLHEIRIGNTVIEISGAAHVFIALLIATVKSALVLAFFMHLLYDKAVNTIILASTLFAAALFIGLTLMDIDVRDSIDKTEAQTLRSGGTDRIIDKAAARDEAGEGNVLDSEGAEDDEDSDDAEGTSDDASDETREGDDAAGQ